MTLFRALIKCLVRPFVAAIPTRLFVILFQYSQPMLIRLAIRFVSRTSSHTQNWQQGCWILAVAFFILVGSAVSTPSLCAVARPVKMCYEKSRQGRKLTRLGRYPQRYTSTRSTG